jgi:succinate-semialdehyde dehydrogenase/glutarate-semialdehyde dehydrogenase
LKKSVLELGGSDPFVVLPSADLDACVRTAVTARVQNNGQSCIAAKRFIVHDQIADDFLTRFTDAMDALVVGDPFESATDVGPIVSETQRDELVGQVEAARAQGAHVHAGDHVPPGDGWYFPPTVISGVTVDMPVAQEEIFGPVALVLRVPDLDAAIAAANATPFGLGSSVWTNEADEIARCVEEIDAGAVFVNAMVASTPELPFGGVKKSGYGRELSELGLKEFANQKTVWIG